jgi:hypothetical protein
MLSTKLKEAAGNSADATLYVDDVFSTYLYTGNGSTQTITNGIDLAGQGGLVWCKSRMPFDTSGNVTNHVLMDSVTNGRLRSNTTAALNAGQNITRLSSGFTVTGTELNSTTSDGTPPNNYASWTFRKAPKFFDVVTYTGNGNGGGQNISHSLTSKPAFIIVKRTDASQNWFCLARASDTNYYTSASGTNDFGLNTSAGGFLYSDQNYATATTFNPLYLDVGNNNANINGATYVAYLYAHDTSSTGIIQCGSFTTNGTVAGYDISLGWQPQYVMIKRSDDAGNWQIFDTMRGFDMSGQCYLFANLSSAESVNYPDTTRYPTATGFHYGGLGSSSGTSFIYMAIRMPNKPPTTGTQVFMPDSHVVPPYQATAGFPVDMVIQGKRNGSWTYNFLILDRLRNTPALQTSSTNAESSTYSVSNTFQSNTTYYDAWSSGGDNEIYEMFKRAPGFFDEVCWSGNSTSNTAIYHNLAVTPELIIMKARNAPNEWNVHTNFGATTYIKTYLNFNWAGSTSTYGTGNTLFSAPTSSSFAVGAVNDSNETGYNYVAYLFATLAGISKVGSYTGNGSSQNIECGFAAGARFFLVKATSTTGSWWVWDSARGITAGNDPALQLNSTAAEITTADAVDPYAAGITVNQEATCSINASGVSYIYLAIS